MSIKVITQRNPFKQEKTVTDYPITSILDIYAQEKMSVPIEDTLVVLNDTLVENYDIVPRDNDILIIKAVPAGERTFVGIGTAAVLGAWAVIASPVLGVTAGAAFLWGAVGGYAIGGMIYDIYNQETSDDNYAISGSDNKSNQYGIVPVIYGSTKFAPTFAASDYTEYVDRETPSTTYVFRVNPLANPGVTIWLNGVDTGFIQVSDVSLPCTVKLSSSATLHIYDFDAFQENGNNTTGLLPIQSISMQSGSTISIETLPDASTYNGNKYVYLHQLYVIGNQPTIVEEVLLEDAPLIGRTRTAITATITGNTITSVGQFGSYTTGMRVLLENCENAGEHIVTSATADVLTVADTLTDETVDCTISYLENNGTFTDYNVDFVYNGQLSSLYPERVIESNLGYGCNFGIYQYYTTPSATTNATLHFAFLNGLCKTSSSGTKSFVDVSYTIEYKLHTATTWTTAETVTSQGKTTEAYYVSRYYEFPDAGTYDLRVKRTTADVDDSSTQDKLTWVSVKTSASTEGNIVSPINESVADDLLLMALRIKATDQISGNMRTVNVVASRWVKDYDSTTGTWVTRASSNPASIFVDTLTNSVLSQHPIPFTSEYFDMDAIEDWHTWCDATSYTYGSTTYEKARYTCNGILTDSSTVEAELLKICAAGRAMFSIIDGKYTVVPERPRSVVQMFTSRNIVRDSFSITRSFDQIPDGVTVGFVNKSLGYLADEFTINEDATDFSTYNLSYVDNYAQAYDLGKYLLNSMNYQTLGYQFSASLDAVVVTRGDRIILQHDAGLSAISSGRVQAVAEDGGLLVALVLDEPVTMEDGKSYGITIRTPSSFETYKLVNAKTTTYTVYIDETVSEFDIVAGDLFSFGLHTQETVSLVVTNVAYDKNMQATISAVLYSDDLYLLGEIPDFTSAITAPSSVPSGVSLTPYTDTTITNIINQQGSTPTIRVFQSQPVPPYNEGDIWMNNTATLDCITASTTTFSTSHWRVRSTATFETLNKETFNTANPEHRWQQIPGSTVPYNLLTVEPYTVSSGDATKSELLVEDSTDWEALNTLASVTVESSILSKVTADSNAETAYAVGRYGANGYMGITYTNLLTSPSAPASQSVVLSAGHTVIQCYRGTISCSYGTASYGSPLEFDSAGETLALTMTDCQFGQVTQTEFIPPYVATTFPNTSESYTPEGTSVVYTVQIYNMHASDKYYLSSITGDASNYIDVYILNSRIYVEVTTADGDYVESYPIAKGTYTITIDWSSGVSFTINGVPHTYSEVGQYYGYSDDAYGYAMNVYGYGDTPIVFATAIDTVTLGVKSGQYFNNTFLEVTV